MINIFDSNSREQATFTGVLQLTTLVVTIEPSQGSRSGPLFCSTAAIQTK